MYHYWMENLSSEYDDIEGIEFYSMNGYKHPNCSLEAITVQPPPKGLQLPNPSSWLVKHVLESYLYRSDSKWLFLVNDAAYIKKDRLINWLRGYTSHIDPTKMKVMFGSCIERAYFFQYISLDSGCLLSRHIVQKILQIDWKWNISITLDIPGQETLSQIADTTDIYIPNYYSDHIVGAPLHSEIDWNFLKNKNFDNLPPCKIPDDLINPSPGQNGICSSNIMRVTDIISWAGGGHTPESKEKFLREVEYLLSDIPDYVGYYYYKLWISICNYNQQPPKPTVILYAPPEHQGKVKKNTTNHTS